MTYDLRTNDGLRAACLALADDPVLMRRQAPWFDDLVELIARVAGADGVERGSIEFHRALWIDHPVPVSSHTYPVASEAVDDSALREWFAARIEGPGPTAETATTFLNEFQRACIARLKPFHEFVPRLQIRRTLATVYPAAMSIELHRGPPKQVSRLLGLKPRTGVMAISLSAMQRLEAVLGPAGPDHRAVALRSLLPHLLALEHAGAAPAEDAPEETEVRDGAPLSPLPAARRRKGLTAIRGLLPMMIQILDAIGDGIRREQLFDFLRTENPDAKESTLGIVANVLVREFGVCAVEDGEYVPTDRGAALLETQDPTELAGWLLTRILGVDHALDWLSTESPLAKSDVLQRLRGVNSGWTTTYAPNSLLNWLRSLGVIESVTNGRLALTSRGRAWAERITWEPEPLKVDGVDDDSVVVVPLGAGPMALPSLASIAAAVAVEGHFPSELVAELHAGLWSSSRRHFAVLAGLSGSGKTLLART